MSTVLGLSDKSRRKSCHRRNDDSGELDVFDAENYFSAINNETTLFHELGMSIRDDCNNTSNNSKQGWREGRVSLDIPTMRYTGNHYHHHHHHHHYHRQLSVSQPKGMLFDNTTNPDRAKEKKHRQPSSPGGRLASFFTSLISQTVSKKKKSSKLSNQTPAKDGVVEEVQSPSIGWRRRMSSNTNSSLFSSTNASSRSRTTTTTTTTTTTDVDHTKQVHSYSGLPSIRISPPDAINTPAKSYKDFRCKNSTTKPSSAKINAAANLDWLDEKFKCIGGLTDKQSSKGFNRQSHWSSEKERVSWVGRNSTSEESSSGFKRFMEDDGGETDSSSDLFELQLNYECSSGLPVYETTCMDNIKRSSATPAITNI